MILKAKKTLLGIIESVDVAAHRHDFNVVHLNNIDISIFTVLVI